MSVLAKVWDNNDLCSQLSHLQRGVEKVSADVRTGHWVAL